MHVRTARDKQPHKGRARIQPESLVLVEALEGKSAVFPLPTSVRRGQYMPQHSKFAGVCTCGRSRLGTCG